MVQTVNGKRMTSPGVILETESQSLESPLLGNGYGGFGEGREETCLESNAPCAYSTVSIPLHRIAARLRFRVNPKGLGLGGKR